MRQAAVSQLPCMNSDSLSSVAVTKWVWFKNGWVWLKYLEYQIRWNLVKPKTGWAQLSQINHEHIRYDMWWYIYIYHISSKASAINVIGSCVSAHAKTRNVRYDSQGLAVKTWMEGVEKSYIYIYNSFYIIYSLKYIIYIIQKKILYIYN